MIFEPRESLLNRVLSSVLTSVFSLGVWGLIFGWLGLPSARQAIIAIVVAVVGLIVVKTLDQL